MKKKVRRKRTSRQSLNAIEKTPFKDTLASGVSTGISADGCLYAYSTHILDCVAVDPMTGFDLLRNIMKVEVGVPINFLLNSKLKSEIDFRPLVLELEKLLKQHKRLQVFKKIAHQRLKLTFPNVDTKPMFLYKEVFHSLYFVIRHVMPSTLLGSTENFKTFMKSVRRLVNASHHQSFSLSSSVHNIKIRDIPWLLTSLPSNSLRLTILARLLKWLLMYVQAVIRRMWQVTVHSSKELIYCNKSVWNQRLHEETQKLVLSGRLEVAGENTDINLILGQTQFHIKKHGLRPITVFKKSSCIKSVELEREARMLLTQLASFTGCKNTLFSPNLEQQLHEAILKIKSCYTDPISRPKYYFVKADVQDAFGSIDHSKMLSILESLFTRTLPPGLMLRKYICSHKKKFLIVYESDQMCLPSTMEWRNLKYLKTESIKHLLLLVKNKISCLGTVIGKSVYRIRHGIPQGMQLSMILCELYYNTLDIEHLKSFQDGPSDEIFIRYCDDYLFVSPRKERVELFLEKVNSGFVDFGVNFNRNKTVTNLKDDTPLFPFFGYLVDTRTFCVSRDFENYRNNKIASSINLKTIQRPGKILLSRMKLFCKLHPMLLDERLNSKCVIAQNIYHVAMLMAFRFCAYVKSCFQNKMKNQAFILKCVKTGERVLRRRIRKYFRSTSKGYWMNVDAIKWLVYQAFLMCLRKHGIWCSRVLKYLNGTCDKVHKNFSRIQEQLFGKFRNAPFYLLGPLASLK